MGSMTLSYKNVNTTILDLFAEFRLGLVIKVIFCPMISSKHNDICAQTSQHVAVVINICNLILYEIILKRYDNQNLYYGRSFFS